MKWVRMGACLLTVLAVAACGSDDGGGGVVEPPMSQCGDPTPVTVQTPPGFPTVISPADNPLTEEGIALGRMLFYDPILSGDSTQACASCHIQSESFSDTLRFSVGIDGIFGNRQAPTIINPAYFLRGMFWDLRAASIEDQATEPVPNPIEMHLAWSDATERLENHDEYPSLFCAAFGDTVVTMERVVKAIAQFERTFISANSPYDRWKRGDDNALTQQEKDGFALFGSEVGDCFHCHDEVLFTDGTARNIGLDAVPADRGRGAITGDPADDGKFKVPSLRNIAVSAPYMHDGRFETLEDVLAHYNHGFVDGPRVDPLIRARLNRAPLTQEQIDAIIAFLHTLTDTTYLNNPDLSNPFTSQP